METKNLVVSRRSTGLGDCLVSMLPAWHYARSTGRSLVVDWRRSPYCLSPEGNAFDLFFDPIRSLGADYKPIRSLGGLKHDQYFPPLSGSGCWERETGDMYRDEILRILKTLQPIDDQVLLCDYCLNEALPDRHKCRELLGGLRLRPHWQRLVQESLDELFDGKPVIGLHLRRGDEAGLHDHRRFWADPAQVMCSIREAIATVRNLVDCSARVFLSTDSPELERILLDAIPGSFSRPRWHPPNTDRTMHDFRNGWQAVADTIVDMQLLAKCNALVRFPPNSFFSFWADVVHARHGVALNAEARTDLSAWDLGCPAIAWSP